MENNNNNIYLFCLMYITTLFSLECVSSTTYSHYVPTAVNKYFNKIS